MIVLDKVCRQAQFTKLVGAERLHKEAARIAAHLRQNNSDIVQVNRLNLKGHAAAAPRGMVWAAPENFLVLRRPHFECNSRLVCPGERLPSAAREVPENQVAGAGGKRQQQKANEPIAKYYLANPE